MDRGDYTGKYVWLRDDSELYPDDPPRTVADGDFRQGRPTAEPVDVGNDG